MTSVLLLLASSAFAGSPAPAAPPTARELLWYFASPNKPLDVQPLPEASETPAQPDAAAAQAMAEFLDALILPRAGALKAAPLRGPAVYLRLAEVKNNYARTSAQFTLGGKKFTVGFGMSRTQEVYLSVLGETEAVPALVNIKGLLNGARDVSVNGGSENVSLSPNIFDKLSSKINIKGFGESRSFKLKDLIAAVQEKGLALPLDGRVYNAYYTDDIKENGGLGVVDPGVQNVAFLLREGGDFHFYMVPFENVPADKISVYELMSPTKLGLQTQEDKAILALFPNP